MKHSTSDNSSKSLTQKITKNEDSAEINESKSLTSSLFKKHKRNSSFNSNTNLISETKGKNSKVPQVTLNSYKKSSQISSITENLAFNPSNEVKSLNPGGDPSHVRSNTNTNSVFNLCPKIDEIPIIEPLVCKRIANERLTSILFKEECFIVATQEGYVYTWVRPSKVNLI